MKQVILCCVALLMSPQFQAQTIEKIVDSYDAYDSLQVQEKVYVQTDRTLFKPGDNIWFNAVVCNAQNYLSTRSCEIFVELLNPKGEVIQSRILKNIVGCTEGHFFLPSNYVGGIYKLRAYSYWMQNFGNEYYFEKELTLQKVVFPNLLLTLDFEREAYGAASQVVANFEARTKENQALSQKKLTFDVFVAGEKFCSETTITDSEGNALLVFTLPKNLATTDVLLNVILEQDGLPESISRSVPVILNDLDVQLLPEGGNLITGYLNRVAFKVLNEFGKPADIKAELVNNEGQSLLNFESYHQGMGFFDFIPKEGQTYHIKILSPTKIDKTWKLPKSSASKVGIYLKEKNKDNLTLDIYSPINQILNIIVQQQGKLVLSQAVVTQIGTNVINLSIQDLPMGIVQITVFDAKKEPCSERLAFINKHRQLEVGIATDKRSYLPREEVEMKLSVKDETGKPLVGHFALAVVDDKQHVFADDKQDNILSYLLMSSDLKGEVYEPNFYFNLEEPKAKKALDLVMLTHGWRRYEWDEILSDTIYNWADSIQFEIDFDEISGYLKINGQLYSEKRVFLSDKKPEYTIKKSLMSIKTDKNGFFKFKRKGLQFPVFVTICHQGFRKVIKVNNYSKSGLKLLKKKEQNQYLNSGSSTAQRKQFIRNTTFGNGLNRAVLKGKIIDVDNEEGLSFANVVLEQSGTSIQVKAIQTDFDGNYVFDSIGTGVYDLLISYVGFPTVKIEEFSFEDGKTIIFDVEMEEARNTFYEGTSQPSEEFILVDTRKQQFNPIFTKDLSLDLSNIKNLSTRNITSIVATTAGINQVDEGGAIEINGSRSSSNLILIDGIPQIGNIPIALLDIDEVEIITSGVPAEFENNNRSVEIIMRGYRIPLVDPSNTSGGQTLTANDINPGANWGGSSSSSFNNRSRSYNSSYDKVEMRQVGVRNNFSVMKAFYVPKYHPIKKIEKRTDFRKTIYWDSNITTDENGEAVLRFCNSDEVTTFRAIVEGIGAEGRLARGEHTYSVQMPFSITAKVPAVLSFWDTLVMPVVLKNTTKKALKGRLNIEIPSALELFQTYPEAITIPANDIRVVYLYCKVKSKKGTYSINIDFEGDGFKDEVEEKIEIASKGFPVTFSMSGQNLEQVDTFIIDNPYKGSIEAEINVYPTILDGLMDGLKGMLKWPTGCFEQVSSSNYPNILALKLMKQTGQLNPGIQKKAFEYLQDGYNKLVAYEIKGGGFEWYGKSPAHEGLTAYGLVQFKDMKEVYDGVSSEMIERTKTFLLNRRDGKGGFKQNVGKYGFRGNKPALFNAYITWALSEVKTQDIDKEIEMMTQEAIKSEDLYRLSLAALTHFNVGNTVQGEKLLVTIKLIVTKVGIEKVSAESTLTYSSGNALNIETLSFVALAMMKSSEVDSLFLLDIIKHVLSLRKYGRFGSTQSTVMAFQALSEYQRIAEETRGDASFVIRINGELVEELVYKKTDKRKLRTSGLAKYLLEGQNIVSIKFKGVEEALSYSFDAQWTSSNSSNDTACSVRLESSLDKIRTNVGENIRMKITLENLEPKSLPSTMALVGIPAGLTVQAWQLKELQEKQVFDFYELRDNYVIFYYNEMNKKETKAFSLDLKTEVPGVYSAPPNVAYLYYNDEYKSWSKGAKVTIEQ
jgi:hypothetical protein